MRNSTTKTLGRENVIRKRNSALPVYHRLYVLIAEGIKDGRYPPGELLPPEKTLAERYEVSRVTVRKALAHLVEDGLVTKRHGQGNIVTLGASSDRENNRVSGLIADLVAQGVDFRAKTLYWDRVVPGRLVIEKLGLPVGAECFLIRRLRSLKRQPVSYASIYLPERVGITLKRKNAARKLILQMLDDSPFAVDHTEYSLSATLADGEIADSLGLAVGSPVLRMLGVAFTAEHVPVYFQDSLYHPDRYEYAVKLSRDTDSTEIAWRHG